MESDAINIDDMVCLYRLEGDYDDDGSSSKHLSASGAAIGFASETPYGHVSGSSSRQVVHFSANGAFASTDGNYLPSGAESRTMMGWFKQTGTPSSWYWWVPFGQHTIWAGWINGMGLIERVLVGYKYDRPQ